MTRLTILLASLGTMLISACTTEPTRLTTIRSEPAQAYVQFGRDNNNQNCLTPCTVKLDRPLRVMVSKEGYKPQVFYIEPNNEDVFVKLELIATTEDVETTGLPDLQGR